MDPLTLIVVAVLAYLAYSGGLLAQFGIVAPPSIVQSGPPVQVVPPAASVVNAPNVNNAVVGGVATGLNAIPVAGPAISSAFKAISSVLLAASAARAKAAVNENAAVAAGIPGFDTAVGQVAGGFNSGSISASQAQTLFAQILSNYWSEVSGKIQSGRNGCNTGASCPPPNNPNSDQSTNAGGNNYCSGNIGAACCVGCADLALSIANLQWAVNQCAKTGQEQSAFIQVVFASKYGGVNRPAYTVNFTPQIAG